MWQDEPRPAPSSLTRHISPPPTRKAPSSRLQPRSNSRVKDDAEDVNEPSVAAVEAGKVHINDHLQYFCKLFGRVCRPSPTPRLSLEDFAALYERNQHPHGRHFVVHQHDHPVSGVHYDLRLQFSNTSSISFAIPYGLPGNPNSLRPNRMAIETRVHNLWNHLIESSSHASGSMLIWDTGEYQVMDKEDKQRHRMTDDEDSQEDGTRTSHGDLSSESERLVRAFQARYIRLRLHGTRLPHNYTIAIRLPSRNEPVGGPRRPKIKRRRVGPVRELSTSQRRKSVANSDSNEDSCDSSRVDAASGTSSNNEGDDAALASEDEEEDATIRATNAYTGATNTIGSIHQRHWFLTLDRQRSGCRKERTGPNKGVWSCPWAPFVVMGRDRERSIVTGRNADEALVDDGVHQFVGRKMWRPVTE